MPMHTMISMITSLKSKALLLIALAFISFSCNKTTEKVGDGLLSESDIIGVYYTDTLQIVCHSETIESMNTKGLSSFLLGSMMDPVMGRTNANFFTQLHLSSTNQDFGSEVVVDSIVLQLGITGYYGDTTTLQTIHVYELDESLSMDSNYRQFDDVSVKDVDLANGYQFYPHPKSYHHIIGSDTLDQPLIRIPLDNSFGEYLTALDPEDYATPEAFKEVCKGLKVCCESVAGDGSICYLTPTTNRVTQLQVYYRESPSSTKPMRYYFYITSEEAYFNQYLHEYDLGSAAFTQQVLDNDTALGQDQLYLQSTGGVRIVMAFPNLTKWADDLQPNEHIIINEAKLIFPASSILDDDSDLTHPDALALLNIVNDEQTTLLQDYYEGASYYGGSYSSAKKSITFRIGEHLQSVISGKQESQGLYVSVSGAAINAQRWIVAGPNADNGLRCKIKYSIVGE